MRKFFILTLLLTSFLTKNAYTEISEDAFCNPLILSAQTFYEDSLVLALYTHKPIVPGHCLVLPKRHVERFEDLSDDEILQIGQTIKKVNRAVMKVFETSAYLLLEKNGKEANQTVPHVHFHYIPKKTGDDSTVLLIFNAIIANLKSPISAKEMQETTKALSEAIQ